jgi:hypothetical protein
MFTTKRSTSTLSWTEKEPSGHATVFDLAVICSLLTILLGGVSCEKEKGTGSASRANSPPVVSAARILPENPTQQSALTASIDAQDPDGDPITYDYQWIKNGADVSAQDNNVLQHSHFKKGDVIRVRVTPGDGKGKGEPFLSPEVKIRNSPPVIQEVWIEPKVAYASDPLKALVKAEDKDGDFVYYTYQWEKNGVLLSEERGAVLEPGRFKKGDSVTVTITPDDRDILGTPKKSPPLVISNSPPVITSSPPSTLSGGSYMYQVKVNDPDNDAVTFALKSAPKGMKINSQSGVIQWEVRKEDKGELPVEIEASDSEGAKSVQRYTMTVEFK